jgi:hypothetical protein
VPGWYKPTFLDDEEDGTTSYNQGKGIAGREFCKNVYMGQLP